MTQIDQDLYNIFEQELQFEILCETLIATGWFRGTAVKCDNTADIEHWVRTHCIHKYYGKDRYWVFENSDDAALFSLTWL